MLAVRVIKELLKLRLQWELAFRLDALFGLFGSLIYIVGGVLLFEVIYGRVESIAGWERPAALALVGTLSLLLELERALLRGLLRLPELVQEGQLEHYLLRPVPAPLVLAFHRVSVQALWRLPLGVGVLAYALSLVPLPPLERFLLYGLSLLMSLAIFGLMVFCLVCLSFWLIEMQNLYWLVYDLAEFARYPASVYKGLVRVILSTVLPLLVLANFPVQLLLREGRPELLLHQLGVLIGFGLLGWTLWQRGLRRYQGASV